MKSFIQLTVLSLSFMTLVGLSSVQAQRISATLNVGSLNLERVTDGNTDINYSGSSSVGLNLRYYTKSKWAWRIGVGLDELNYTVGDGINTDYAAQRQDLKGYLGLEKHFILANFIDVYPGVFVPITVVGEDVIQQNFDNIKNGDLRAGLGVMLGANFKFLKILRFGVEFDATFDDFKAGVWEGVETLSFVPIKGIHHNTNFTVGVAF